MCKCKDLSPVHTERLAKAVQKWVEHFAKEWYSTHSLAESLAKICHFCIANVQCERNLTPFLLALWVAQYKLNGVLCNPRDIHKGAFHLYMPQIRTLHQVSELENPRNADKKDTHNEC